MSNSNSNPDNFMFIIPGKKSKPNNVVVNSQMIVDEVFSENEEVEEQEEEEEETQKAWSSYYDSIAGYEEENESDVLGRLISFTSQKLLIRPSLPEETDFKVFSNVLLNGLSIAQGSTLEVGSFILILRNGYKGDLRVGKGDLNNIDPKTVVSLHYSVYRVMDFNKNLEDGIIS
jgi:hypothetical protein